MGSYSGGGQAGQAFADNFLRAFGMAQDLKYRNRQEQRQAGLDAQADERYEEEKKHRAEREAKADQQTERTYGFQVKQDARAEESHGEAMASSRQKRNLVDRQVKFGDALTRLAALPEDAPPEVKGEAARKLVLDATGYDMAEMLGSEWQQSLAHLQNVKAGKAPLRTKETLAAARAVLAPIINSRKGEKVEKAYKTRDGQEIPAGSVRENTQLGDIIPYQGKLTFDLDVTVRTPDGRTITYGAPMTEGRSTDDADGVKAVGVDEVLAHIMGLEKMQKVAQQMLEGGYLTTAGAVNPRALGGRGGSANSAQLVYAQAFADSAYGKKHLGGDVGAAIAWLKANPLQAKAQLTKALTGIKDLRGNPKYTTAQVQEMVDAYQPDNFAPDPAQQADEAADATASAPGAAAHEGMTQVGTTPDGKPVYEDAQGNRFVED